MSEKIITFSKSLTVGAKGYKDLDIENPELAFMTPNTADSNYEKRLATLKSWCKGYGNKAEEKLNEFDNSPTTGFQILNAQSRYSTDNKVFRLKDPRGFILEIYTGNLEKILQTSNILKGGFIEEPCVWGRQGNNNVLVAVSSEEYNTSVKFAEKQTTNVKDLSVNDTVKFKDGSEYTFLGEYYAVISKQTRLDKVSTDWNYTRSPSRHSFALSQSEKYYAFKSVKHQNIDLMKKIKPCAVIGKSEIAVKDFYKKTNNMYIRFPSTDYSKTVLAIFKTTFKVSNMQYVMDMTEIDVDIENIDKHSAKTIYAVDYETSQIKRLYLSRFYDNKYDSSYSMIEYNVLEPIQYKSIEGNVDRKNPILIDKLMFIKGLNIVLDTDVGEIYLNDD